VTRKPTTKRYLYFGGCELKIGCHSASPAGLIESKTPFGADEVRPDAAGNRHRPLSLPLDSVFGTSEHSQD
jgi:hypothetical protein